MKVHRITTSELKLLNEICEYRNEYGYSPTNPELTKLTGFVKSHVQKLVKRLIAMDYLTCDKDDANFIIYRSIKLKEQS